MSPKQKLIARCKELGCMLTDDGEVLRVDPPEGKVITVTEAHSIDFTLTGWTRLEAYAEILDDLRDGIEPCTLEDCDTCSEPSSFEDILKTFPAMRLA